MQYKMKTLASAKYLILLASTLVLLACGPELTDQQMLKNAKTYVEQNKLREAALELKNVLQENPDNAEARYLLGMINLNAGDAPTAEKEFRRAADAGWPESLSRIGQARAMINNRSFQAIIDEINIKDDFPANDRADLLALRALAHANLGNSDQAMATLADAIKIDADAFHVLKTAIQIHLSNNDMEQASENLKKALAQYSDNPEILLLSAAMSIRNNDSAAASEAYKKIIARDPEKLVTVYGKQARLGLARLEILNAELDKAKLTLSPLIQNNVTDPEVNFVSGLLAFEQGELELAAERLLAVLKVAPDHAPTQLLFGTVNYALQNYEQATYYISKYISVVPENINARKLLGRAYLQLGQHDEAQAALQAGMESNAANDAELMALVGLSQLQGGDTVSGIAGLERAVKSAPESLTLRSELARAYISAGETENAIRELNTILAGSGDKKQAETLLISAHIKAGHYDKAIDTVLSMLQKSPDDPAVLSLAGNVFAVSNNRAEARKYFNKALQIMPSYAPATMLLARLEIIDGHPAKAEALYKKLAEANTADIAPLMALAHLAKSQNQTSKMIEWLEKARAAETGNVKPLKILAEHYLKEGQPDKAAPLLSEALKIAPRDNTLLLLQAKLQIDEGYQNKALSTLNEIVSRSPDALLARTMLAEIYLKLDQPADARQHLVKVLESQPYYVPALLLMTQLELRSENSANALAAAKKIQTIKPEFYLGYELAGDAFMIKKDYPAAAESYTQALQLNPMAELAIKLSETSTRTGDSEAAVKPLLTWLSNHPDEVRVLEFLGAAQQNMKQNQNAISTYEKLLVLQPDNIVALNNLAWLYSLEDNPKSLKLAERAYALNSSDAGIQDTYGWVLVQQGQVAKGRQILEQTIKVLPDVPEVQYHYAVALLKSGDEREARKILEKLLQSDASFVGRNEAELLLK